MKMTIMSKIAAEKRTRTYSVDDHTYAAENGHTDAEATAACNLDVPEVVALTKTSQSSLHNKRLDVDGQAEHRSRQASLSLTASQRSIARRNAASPFLRAVSSFSTVDDDKGTRINSRPQPYHEF